ncbi:MAG: SDR family oxidoreductase [Rhodospirillaceae bacterium]|nr:SDR family oxidoreductase [Rhodospirillaceae bacterium]
MTNLSGKVALVTGAGQGVGQGIALALARAGAAVAVTGRTESKLVETCAQIKAFGGKSVSIACNVRAVGDLARTVEKTAADFGGIDILVNNAQEVPLGRLMDVADEAFLGGFESGPLASFRLMKMVHPYMVKRGGGVMFNLATSAAQRWDMSGYGTYAAVKQAIRSLTRAGAAEWGPDGIRVLTIAPHADSPALKWWIANRPAESAEFFKTIPLGRIGECERDIGNAIVALCGPEMGYLTGATIPLDGGQANFH